MKWLLYLVSFCIVQNSFGKTERVIIPTEMTKDDNDEFLVFRYESEYSSQFKVGYVMKNNNLTVPFVTGEETYSYSMSGVEFSIGFRVSDTVGSMVFELSQGSLSEEFLNTTETQVKAAKAEMMHYVSEKFYLYLAHDLYKETKFADASVPYVNNKGSIILDRDLKLSQLSGYFGLGYSLSKNLNLTIIYSQSQIEIKEAFDYKVTVGSSDYFISSDLNLMQEQSIFAKIDWVFNGNL